MSSNEYLSKEFVNGVYIPSGLLVVGVAIVKLQWLPFAIALAAALAGWKILSNSKCWNHSAGFEQADSLPGNVLIHNLEPKAVLKPAVLQDFKLTEKTIITHNVAM